VVEPKAFMSQKLTSTTDLKCIMGCEQ